MDLFSQFVYNSPGNLLYNNVVNRSFTAMFGINSCLMLIATLHCLLFLKWQTRPEQQSLRQAGIRNPIADFFDFNNIKQTLVTLTKRRPQNRRLFLWFLLISMAFYTFQRGRFSCFYASGLVMANVLSLQNIYH